MALLEIGCRVALLHVATAALAGAQCEVESFASPITGSGDHFGEAVAIDDDRMVVGATMFDSAGMGDALYVYERTPGGPTEWTHTAAIAAPVPGSFGDNVALLGDRILAGAWGADAAGTDSGGAWIFELAPGASTWTLAATLTPAGHAAGDQLGRSVALGPDRAVVGSITGVHVFDRVGGSWTHTAALAASDLVPIGHSLGLDGETFVTGAHTLDPFGSHPRPVYVFERVAGLWTETQRIETPMPTSGETFGFSLDLEGDRLALGRPNHLPFFQVLGSALVYERPPGGGPFAQVAELVNSDTALADRFGDSVALEGDRLVVGASGHGATGKAYLFERGPAGWTEAAGIVGSSASADATFAEVLALSGTDLVVGGSGIPIFSTIAGRVWTFEVPCLDLKATPSGLSLATGGVQTLELDVGEPSGALPYVIVGTISGTSPGLVLGGVTIPINVDVYTLVALASPNADAWSGFAGLLDAAGTASATLTLAPGFPPGLAGSVFHHVGLVFDAQLAIGLVTETASLTLVP